MFRFFRRKQAHSNGTSTNPPQMCDIDGQPLQEGDLVMSLRYELGACRLINGDQGLWYESLETGEKVHYLKMVDAATSYQKVRKLEN